MKEGVEDHLFWKLALWYNTCCNSGYAHCNNTLGCCFLLNHLPFPWENRRKQGVQK